MGAIKTTFSVLLSSLFLVNRQRAHLSRHLGSFTGMMLIPPVTEFVLLRSHDWQSALYLHLGTYQNGLRILHNATYKIHYIRLYNHITLNIITCIALLYNLLYSFDVLFTGVLVIRCDAGAVKNRCRWRRTARSIAVPIRGRFNYNSPGCRKLLRKVAISNDMEHDWQ